MSKNEPLDAQQVRALLDYDQETGEFRWYKPYGKAVRCPVAGSPSKAGYLRVGIGGRLYYLHRLAFLHVTGQWPGPHVDHINGKHDDNRWVNLRSTTCSGNLSNRRGAARNSRLGVLGVTQVPNGFNAEIKVAGKRYRLGVFPTINEASAAYQDAKTRLVHL